MGELERPVAKKLSGASEVCLKSEYWVVSPGLISEGCIVELPVLEKVVFELKIKTEGGKNENQ